MGKSKSFADKMNKANQDSTSHCAQCGESIATVKLITSEKAEDTGAWKFRQNFIGICKCNEKDVLG